MVKHEDKGKQHQKVNLYYFHALQVASDIMLLVALKEHQQVARSPVLGKHVEDRKGLTLVGCKEEGA